MTERLLTADELAERLQVSKQQVYRLTRSGELPVRRVGKHLRYRRDAIDAWELGQ